MGAREPGPRRLRPHRPSTARRLHDLRPPGIRRRPAPRARPRARRQLERPRPRPPRRRPARPRRRGPASTARSARPPRARPPRPRRRARPAPASPRGPCPRRAAHPGARQRGRPSGRHRPSRARGPRPACAGDRLGDAPLHGGGQVGRRRRGPPATPASRSARRVAVGEDAGPGTEQHGEHVRDPTGPIPSAAVASREQGGDGQPASPRRTRAAAPVRSPRERAHEPPCPAAHPWV